MATDLREQLDRWARENDVELIFFDPPEDFDHAIVGVVRGFGQEFAVVYDEQKVLEAITKSVAGVGNGDEADGEIAREWFEFNTVGAYVGEATPRFLIRPWELLEPELEAEE